MTPITWRHPTNLRKIELLCWNLCTVTQKAGETRKGLTTNSTEWTECRRDPKKRWERVPFIRVNQGIPYPVSAATLPAGKHNLPPHSKRKHKSGFDIHKKSEVEVIWPRNVGDRLNIGKIEVTWSVYEQRWEASPLKMRITEAGPVAVWDLSAIRPT